MVVAVVVLILTILQTSLGVRFFVMYFISQFVLKLMCSFLVAVVEFRNLYFHCAIAPVFLKELRRCQQTIRISKLHLVQVTSVVRLA